ncbi:MAG: hypothetical protein MZW92_66820 [Comamonadaceae bacterium]|nr:hypothetical protein [Comamonadaceae bacterium]
MVQAGVYSAVLHYLKAVEGGRAPTTATKVDRADEEDADRRPLFGKGGDPRRRPHGPPTCTWSQVKKPAESKGPWDYYKLRADDPGRPGVPAAGATASARW